MSDNANIEDFNCIFEVGLYNQKPACKTHAGDELISPVMLAGMMTAMLDAMISDIPESKQIQFEEKALDIFSNMIKYRFDHINKYILPEE